MDRIKVAKRLLSIARLVFSAEGDKCGEKGCIRKEGQFWRVMSGKTGKFWPAKYRTKGQAEKAIKRYHGWGF